MNDRLIKESDVLKAINKALDRETLLNRLVRKIVLDAIISIPSAEISQGEWKRRLVDNGFNADWVCSECGYRVKTDFVSFNFCPNCGARMKGTKNDSNSE